MHRPALCGNASGDEQEGADMRWRHAALASALMLATAVGAAQAKTIEWAAGQLGGGWYTMASGMAKILQDNVKGLEVKVVPGGGTANPSKIQLGQSQLAMGLDIFAKMARDGKGIYKGKPHDKVMMIGQSFSDNYMHFIRAKGAKLGFKDVFKAHDVNLAVTKVGSSDEMTFRFVMQHYGTSYEKLRGNRLQDRPGRLQRARLGLQGRQVDYCLADPGHPAARPCST